MSIGGGLYVLSAHNEGQADAHVTFSGWDATGANILTDSATIPAGASVQSPAAVAPGVYSFLISSDKTTISPNLWVSQSPTSFQQFSARQWGASGNADWNSSTRTGGDINWSSGSR